MFKTLTAAVMAATLAAPVWAADITVTDSYARAATPNAKAGAVFLVLENTSGTDDTLIGASTPVAHRAELHTHQEDANGVMKMRHVHEGFAVPQGETLRMERGGNHVMLMGLNQSLLAGESIDLTLTFEKAGEVTITVPVDLER